MLDLARIRSLPRLAAPVLSAYLDTNPATARNQSSPPGYLAWLKARARAIDGDVPVAERPAFRGHVRRVERHLRSQPPRDRAVVAFSGQDTWERLALQVKVEDELSWGPPALKQLFWLLDEHHPSGTVVVSRSGARFLRTWLGETVEEEGEAFAVDRSAWRTKHLVGPSHGGVAKRRGVQRDLFNRRMTVQLRRFARGLSARIQRWAERHELRLVVLAGPAEMVEAIFAEMPETFRERVALVRDNLSRLSPPKLQARLGPELDRWMRAYEAAQVEALIGEGSRRAVVGLDDTLARLQEGRVRERAGDPSRHRRDRAAMRALRLRGPVGRPPVSELWRRPAPDASPRRDAGARAPSWRAGRGGRGAGREPTARGRGIGAWLGLPDRSRPRRGA